MTKMLGCEKENVFQEDSSDNHAPVVIQGNSNEIGSIVAIAVSHAFILSTVAGVEEHLSSELCIEVFNVYHNASIARLPSEVKIYLRLWQEKQLHFSLALWRS